MKRKKAFLSLFSRFGWLFFFLCIIAVSLFYGAARCGSVDFVCTNGDYQNYNALRRFLAGQHPYADFANYLGMGPLLLCAPLTALHNNFSGSLFATNFVACACFILFVFLIFYLVTGHKLLSAAAGLLAPKILSSMAACPASHCRRIRGDLSQSAGKNRGTPSGLRGCFCRFCTVFYSCFSSGIGKGKEILSPSGQCCAAAVSVLLSAFSLGWGSSGAMTSDSPASAALCWSC